MKISVTDCCLSELGAKKAGEVKFLSGFIVFIRKSPDSLVNLNRQAIRLRYIGQTIRVLFK